MIFEDAIDYILRRVVKAELFQDFNFAHFAIAFFVFAGDSFQQVKPHPKENPATGLAAGEPKITIVVLNQAAACNEVLQDFFVGMPGQPSRKQALDAS